MMQAGDSIFQAVPPGSASGVRLNSLSLFDLPRLGDSTHTIRPLLLIQLRDRAKIADALSFARLIAVTLLRSGDALLPTYRRRVSGSPVAHP